MKKLILLTTMASLIGAPPVTFAQGPGDFAIRIPVETVAYVPSSQTYDFGPVIKGQSVQRSFTLTNQSSAPIAVQDFDEQGLRVVGSTCSGELETAQSCSVTVELLVANLGANMGTLRINHTGHSTADEFIVKAQGIEAEGIIQATPAFLDFGNTSLRVPVGPRDLVLKNVGTGPLDIIELYLGENGTNFTVQNDECYWLEPGDSCTVKVTFTARTSGMNQGRLVAELGDGHIVQAAMLGGNVALGVASWVSSNLLFKDVPPKTSSEEQSATLKNTGKGPLNISRIRIAGDGAFAITQNSCGAVLPPQTSCTVMVKAYAPDSLQRSAILIAETTNSVSPSVSAQVLLMPSTDQALLTISPSVLDFGKQPLNSPIDRDITVTSTGQKPVQITDFKVIGANADSFSVLNAGSCVGTLAPEASCTLTIRGTAKALASATAQLTAVAVTDVPVSPASLRIEGEAGSLTLSPASLVFEALEVGKTSTKEAVLTNNSGLPVQVTYLTPNSSATGANYSISGCANTTIAPGATCTVSVSFKPTTTGAHPGFFNINNGGIPASLQLNVIGTGIPAKLPAGNLTAFTCPADVSVGVPATCTATLSNTGELPLTVGSLSRSGTLFGVPTSNCGAELPVGASCTVSVQGTFNAAGTFSTTVTATTGAGPLTSVASVTVKAPLVTLNTFAHDATAVGTPTFQTHLLTNNSNQSVALTVPPQVVTSTRPTGSASTAGFSYVTTTCGVTLNAGASCSITTRFNPDQPGSFGGTLTVPVKVGTWTGSASGPLSGPATPAPDATKWLEAVPSPVNWGTVFVPTTAGSSRVVTIYNRSTSTAATGLRFAIEGDSASEVSVASHTCGTSIGAGSNCSVTLTWKPTAAPGATLNADLVVSSTLPTLIVPLMAQTGGGMLEAAPVDFGVVKIGTTKTLPVVFTNVGTAMVSRPSAAVLTGATSEFTSVMGTCPASIPAGGTCTYNVTFKPTAIPAVSATLTQANSGYAAPTTAVVTGMGSPADVATLTVSDFVCTPAAVGAGTPFRCETTLTSTGTANITYVTVTKTSTATGWQNPALSGCSFPLVPGASCTAYITGTGFGTTTMTMPVNFASNAPAVVKTAQVSMLVAELEFSGEPFGNVQVNTGKSLVYTLTNKGAANANFGSILPVVKTNPPFTYISKTCGLTLAPGQSCDVTVTCMPRAVANYNGELSFQSSANTARMPLSCTGVSARMDVTPEGGLSKDVGGHSLSGNWYRVTNSGVGLVTLSTFTASTGWTLAGVASDPTQCAVNKRLMPGDSCLVKATATTLMPGNKYTGSFNIASSGGNISWTAELEAVGASITPVNPLSMGGTNVPQSGEYRVTNVSKWPLSSVQIIFTGTGYFIAANNCRDVTLNSGDSCLVTVSHTSATAGVFNATMQVRGTYPQVLNGQAQPLVGTLGVQASLTISRQVVVPLVTWQVGTYPPTALNSESQTTSYLRNDGLVPVTFTGPGTITGAYHTLVSTTCTANLVLQPGERCEYVTKFAPKALTNLNATLTAPLNIGNRTATLIGNLMAQSDVSVVVTSSPAEIALGGTATVSITVSNPSATGTAKVALNYGTIGISGTAVASRTGATCTGSKATASCSSVTNGSAAMTLGPASSVLLRYTVTATQAAGILRSNANIAVTDVQDTNTANNSATADTRVTPPSADLAIAIGGLPSPIGADTSYNMTLTVRNNSVAGQPLTAALGSGKTSIGVVVNSGNASVSLGGTVCGTTSAGATCANNGDVVIPPGGFVNFTVATTWRGNGTVTVTATITPTGPVPDPNLANNTAVLSQRPVKDVQTAKWCYWTSKRVGVWPGGNCAGYGGGTASSGLCNPVWRGVGWMIPQLFDGGKLSEYSGHPNVYSILDKDARWKTTGKPVAVVLQGSNGSLREDKGMPEDLLVGPINRFLGHWPQVQVWQNNRWSGTWRNTLNGKQYPTIMSYWSGTGSDPGLSYHPRNKPAGTVAFWGVYQGTWVFHANKQPYINYTSEGVAEDGLRYRQIWYELSPGPNCQVAGTARIG